jgi:hypothetical protein
MLIGGIAPPFFGLIYGCARIPTTHSYPLFSTSFSLTSFDTLHLHVLILAMSSSPMLHTPWQPTMVTLPSNLQHPPERMWCNSPIYRQMQIDGQRINILIDGTGLSLESFTSFQPVPSRPPRWHVAVRFYGRIVGHTTTVCLQQTDYIFPQGKPDIVFVLHNKVNPRGLEEITYYHVIESDHLSPRYSLQRVTSCGDPLTPDGMFIRESSSSVDSDNDFDMVEVDNDFHSLTVNETPDYDDDTTNDEEAAHWDIRHRHLQRRTPPLLRNE